MVDLCNNYHNAESAQYWRKRLHAFVIGWEFMYDFVPSKNQHKAAQRGAKLMGNISFRAGGMATTAYLKCKTHSNQYACLDDSELWSVSNEFNLQNLKTDCSLLNLIDWATSHLLMWACCLSTIHMAFFFVFRTLCHFQLSETVERTLGMRRGEEK